MFAATHKHYATGLQALASVIGFIELTKAGTMIVNATFKPFLSRVNASFSLGRDSNALTAASPSRRSRT